MATQKHVDILKKGSKEWNEWRKQYPSIIPDLSFAKLIELLLSEVDLSFANLSGADLSFTTLFEADLHNANLHEARLYGTNLVNVDLSGTDLTRAYLVNADLTGANCEGSDTTEANFKGAIVILSELTAMGLLGKVDTNLLRDSATWHHKRHSLSARRDAWNYQVSNLQ